MIYRWMIWFKLELKHRKHISAHPTFPLVSVFLAGLFLPQCPRSTPACRKWTAIDSREDCRYISCLYYLTWVNKAENSQALVALHGWAPHHHHTTTTPPPPPPPPLLYFSTQKGRRAHPAAETLSAERGYRSRHSVLVFPLIMIILHLT